MAILITGTVFSQTDISFNNITSTSERAIRLSWNSNSNEVYEIDYADSLIDTNTGSITWNRLFMGYPSHGTNTFWLDTGNYNVEPAIPHPKYGAMRFYRIANQGTNSGPSPFVVIASPTNGSVLSGQVIISVVVTSTLPLLSTELFVDGQEMKPSDDGTNYVINTCEWPNGAHTFFATARGRSSYSGPKGVFPIDIGQAVSAYVPVTFSNLVTSIAFSQPFFEPSLGQTQQVTAAFAANVNWTLYVLDESSNAVRTVTGSGGSMLFNWDGTGDGGTAIPDGVYYYQITAQTNGLALTSEVPPTDGGGSPPSMMAASLAMSSQENADSASYPTSPEQAMMAGLTSYFIQSPPLPWETNGAVPPMTEVPIPPLTQEQFLQSVSTSGMMSLASMEGMDAAGPEAAAAATSPQSSPLAPTRPPTAPTKGSGGNYAIGFYNFPTLLTLHVPKNGVTPPLDKKLHLESSTDDMKFDKIPEADTTAINMANSMKNRGWKLAFERFNEDLTAQSMRRSDLGIGGGEVFTQATIGLFIDHGTFGTDIDFSAGCNKAMVTYFPSGDPGSALDPWIRMGQFGFGGNLKWMAILACNSLCDPNYDSMTSSPGGAIPLKGTHLLCGTASIAGVGENIGSYWTINMLKQNQTIVDAWFNAGNKEYTGSVGLSNTVVFRVTGYPECFADTIKSNTAPTKPSAAPGNLTKRDSTVFQYP